MSEDATKDIAYWGEQALFGFQECLDKAVEVHPREYSLFEDQLARFSIWASGIGVFAQGRASTDHRLREVTEVHDAVTSLLENVASGIKDCLHVLKSIISPQIEIVEDVSMLTDGRLAQSLQVVADEISMLYRLSNTIRRASRESQNIKAAKVSSTSSGDGSDIDATLRRVYSHYISGKFPNLGDGLRERLASSILIRRKRIFYRRSRYGYSGIQAKKTTSQPKIQQPQNQRQAPVKTDVARVSESGMDVKQAKSNVQSQAASASILSKNAYKKALNPSTVSSSKTFALGRDESLTFPTPPIQRIRIRYKAKQKERQQMHKESQTSLDTSQLDSGQLDRISEAKKQLHSNLDPDWIECCNAVPEVTCPFCLYTLPSIFVSDDRKWKTHVIGDLDAYVCLFDECDEPEELYRHSADWWSHMRDHTLRWRCKSRSHTMQTFPTEKQYLDHMTESHPASLTKAQLDALAERNARPTVPMFENCPICGTEEAEDNLEAHIVGHLRFLALKFLPIDESEVPDSPDEQEDASDVSLSRSTMKEGSERHSPLVFDEHRLDGVSIQASGQDEWKFTTDNDTEDLEDIGNDQVIQGMLQQKQIMVTHRYESLDVLEKCLKAFGYQKGDYKINVSLDIFYESAITKALQDNNRPGIVILFLNGRKLTQEQVAEIHASYVAEYNKRNSKFRPTTIVQHRYEEVAVLEKCLKEFGYKKEDYKISDKNRPGIQIQLPNGEKLTEEQVKKIHAAYISHHRDRRSRIGRME